MERKMMYEYLGLIVVLILAVLVRVFAGRNSLTENVVLFYGYDEYYHMRRILYTIDHFPSVLWFDSYLNYPRGLRLTWPPLFDQLAAAVSLALGQHSQPEVEVLIAFLPIFLGSVAIVLIYYLTRELFNRKTALLTAFMAAIAPYFVKKTMIGAIDHHSLEVLLALSVLFFLVLTSTRKDEMYVFSIASGIMMAGLIYTWLGSPIYLGIILIYAFCQMTLDLKQGSSSNDTIKALLTAFCVSLILSLPFRNAAWMQSSFISILIFMIFQDYLPPKREDIDSQVFMIPVIGYGLLCAIFILWALRVGMYSLAVVGFITMSPTVIVNLALFLRWRTLAGESRLNQSCQTNVL